MTQPLKDVFVGELALRAEVERQTSTLHKCSVWSAGETGRWRAAAVPLSFPRPTGRSRRLLPCHSALSVPPRRQDAEYATNSTCSPRLSKGNDAPISRLHPDETSVQNETVCLQFAEGYPRIHILTPRIPHGLRGWLRLRYSGMQHLGSLDLTFSSTPMLDLSTCSHQPIIGGR